MRKNLHALRSEIEEYLESRGIVVFQSFPRSGEHGSPVYWDTEQYPDYHRFLAAAEAAGVRIVTLYSRDLDEDMVDDALAQLDESDLERDERKAIESRLKEMRTYAGFTCQIEVSFDLAQRAYIFDLRTEWFDELSELIDRIEESYSIEGDDEPLSGGGYFSKN